MTKYGEDSYESRFYLKYRDSWYPKHWSKAKLDAELRRDSPSREYWRELTKAIVAVEYGKLLPIIDEQCLASVDHLADKQQVIHMALSRGIRIKPDTASALLDALVRDARLNEPKAGKLQKHQKEGANKAE